MQQQCRREPEGSSKLALTRLGLAELPLEHDPYERTEAIERLAFAIREFREMKMQPSLRHRELLKAWASDPGVVAFETRLAPSSRRRGR